MRTYVCAYVLKYLPLRPRMWSRLCVIVQQNVENAIGKAKESVCM